MIIRRATLEDIPTMIQIKESLAFDGHSETATSTDGGFLLGADDKGYRTRISCGCSWVLDVDGVKGFSIVLPDQALRMSELWHRRSEIEWSTTFDDLESKKLGYFDQLAVSKGAWRSHAPVLAITTVLDFLSLRPDYLLSTTVLKPVQNLAAVPYLQYLGATRVGKIDEVDPHVGQLLSEVWLAKQASLRHFLEHPPSEKIASYIDQAHLHFNRYNL